MTMYERPSVVSGVGLEGYLSRQQATPGSGLSAHLGGPDLPAEIEVLKISGSQRAEVLGDPGARRQWGQPDRALVTDQPIDFGSYVEIPHAPHLNPAGSFTFGCWIYPTRLAGGWQAIAAKWAPGAMSFGLFVAADKVLTGSVSFDGVRAQWCSAQEFVHLSTWQYVALSWRADSGQLTVFQKFTTTPPRYTPYEITPSTCVLPESGPVHPGTAPLIFGAIADPGGSRRHVAHFNGRLADPLLLTRPVSADDIERMAGRDSWMADGTVLGAWDLSRNVSTSQVVDTSEHHHHGIAVNCPTRAVTGPHYEERPSRGDGLRPTYAVRPDLFTAIHLHEDDLDDAGWPSTFELAVPADADQGIYAIRAHTALDEIYLPFLVTAAARTQRIAVLAPTYTWTAYSTNRSAHTWQCDGVADRGRCLYDVHTDGTAVYYVSRRRPSRTGNPWFKRFGGDKIIALVYLLEWLDAQGYLYDLVSDEQLHHQDAALDGYDCLLMAGHNEYWTLPMLRALESYLAAGGRVMYLAGDGFTWVTSTDPGRPYVLECRKNSAGDYNPAIPLDPAEAVHSTSLEIGGSWSGRGWRGRDLVGVEGSTAVYLESAGERGFQRSPESHVRAYEWIFDGVAGTLIGAYGNNLGSAAGHEMDGVPPGGGPASAARTVRLARAADPSWWAAGGLDHSACDIAFTEFPGGGAVFAAGSITWSGSLTHPGGDNVARITRNVLERFLATPRGVDVIPADASRFAVTSRSVGS